MGQNQSQCNCRSTCDLKTFTLYHGTTEQAAHQIWRTKVFKGSKGRLGFGGYFCEIKQVAKKIGLYRAKQRDEDAAVISCTVKVRACKYKKQKHPTWQGVCQAFYEYCIEKAAIQFDAYDVVRNPEKGKIGARKKAFMLTTDQSQNGFFLQIRNQSSEKDNENDNPPQLNLLLALAEHNRRQQMQRNLKGIMLLAALMNSSNEKQ